MARISIIISNDLISKIMFDYVCVLLVKSGKLNKSFLLSSFKSAFGKVHDLSIPLFNILLSYLVLTINIFAFFCKL